MLNTNSWKKVSSVIVISLMTILISSLFVVSVGGGQSVTILEEASPRLSEMKKSKPLPRSPDFFIETDFNGSSEANDNFGFSMAAGDFNGDGYEDIAVGTPFDDIPGNDNVGKVSIAYGSANGLNGNPAWPGFQFAQDIYAGAGTEAQDKFGFALATGDFNGDGFDDLAIGTPYEDLGGVGDDAGSVSIVYGSDNGLNGGSQEVQIFTQADLDGMSAESDDRFGYSLAAGHFNDDIYCDLAIGSPGEDIKFPELACVFETNDVGSVALVYGAEDGLDAGFYYNRTLTPLDAGFRWACLLIANLDWKFGNSLACGDSDNNGIDELAVGMTEYDMFEFPYADTSDMGMVIEFNFASEDSPRWYMQGLDDWEDCLASGCLRENEYLDRYGSALVYGDFNGDAQRQLVVGIPLEDYLGMDDAGAIDLPLCFWRRDSNIYRVRFYQDDTYGNCEPDDSFGNSLATGDLDGDGFEDLVVGSYKEDVYASGRNQVNAGIVTIMWGGKNGPGGLHESSEIFPDSLFFDFGSFPDLPSIVYDQLPDMPIVPATWVVNPLLPVDALGLSQENLRGISEWDDQFGTSIVVGDFNGDGIDDLAIGTPKEDIGSGDDEGAIYVVYGPVADIYWGGSSLMEGLVAYWNFDVDFSATFGGPTFDAQASIDPPGIYSAGKFGSGVYFIAGNDEYLDIQAPVITQGQDHSYSAWYKLSDPALDVPGQRYFVMETRNASYNNGWSISYGLRDTDSDAYYSQALTEPSTSSTSIGLMDSYEGGDGNWHNIVVTYDADRAEHSVYLDGVLESTVESSSELMDTAGLIIGGHRAGSGRNWWGVIDDVGVWGRVLTPDEISAIQSSPIMSDVATIGDVPGPVSHRLSQNYPNPFNPMTTIKFDLPMSGRVSLRVYDISGRLVKTLIHGETVPAGQREVDWRGRDEAGRPVAAGVYFYRLDAGAFSETKAMMLVK